MKILFTYIGNFKEYLIFSALIVISIILIFQNQNIQIRFLRAAAVAVIGTVQDSFSFIPNYFKLEDENKTLRETNLNLSVELSKLKEAKLENIRLREMLQFKMSMPIKTVSAKIIGKTLIQTRNNITIDRGTSDSVFSGMPVITDKGLVGKVVATSSSYSIVQILLNKDLKVSSKNQRSRVDGIISWDGENNRIQMKNVSKSADVLVGDVIITSDYSNTFPPGIPIGYTVEVGTVDNLFKKIEIEPFVNFETLEEVFVLTYLPDEERKELEKKYTKKLK
ncbi:MAG: rod shape-determining protein MreC [Ignavibacteria bacterium]|nr:rod shape-determining protein MreC [Ignavibacteria bacterium]